MAKRPGSAWPMEADGLAAACSKDELTDEALKAGIRVTSRHDEGPAAPAPSPTPWPDDQESS